MIGGQQPPGVKENANCSKDPSFLKVYWNFGAKDYNADSDWFHKEKLLYDDATREYAVGRAVTVLVQGTGLPVVGSD